MRSATTEPSFPIQINPDRQAPRAPSRGRAPALGIAGVALAALLAGPGCRDHVRYAPVVEARFVPPPPVMTVHNAGDKPLAAIRLKPCGASDADYQALAGSDLAPGASLHIPIDQHPDCVDLEATNRRGERVGQQKDLHMVAGGGWTIQ